MARTCSYCLTPASTSDSLPPSTEQLQSSTSLKLCARCRSAAYCSRECQRADWPVHKRTCVAEEVTGSGAAAQANDSAYQYWNHKAHLDTDAVALVDRLGLEFPRGGPGIKSGITYPLRRLIVTGHDIPPNLSLLLGPAVTSPSTIAGYDSMRKHVLLQPPRGSPAEAMYRGLDAGLPDDLHHPRPADSAEEAALRPVRAMQGKVTERLEQEGAGRKEVTTADMKAVLVELFGDRWSEALQDWQDAVNCMDQGVDV